MEGDMKNRKDEALLQIWQERFEKAETEYKPERDRMDHRERRLDGEGVILAPDGKAAKEQATHVRNLCFEIVETQVDSNIPQPKVTAVREEDEEKAKLIEDMLRNILDRLPMERINDEAERISPTQGGYVLIVDWFNEASGRGWMGDLKVTLKHPRTIVPQAGIYQVADMDYIFVKDAMTKQQIKKRYGKDVSTENEEDPQARTKEGDGTTDELVTMITGYFRNEEGGIGRIRWVNETLLEYLEDYQVRRIKRCKCGAIGDGIKCRYCGSKAFTEELQHEETLTGDMKTGGGTIIPGESYARDEYGQVMMQDVGAPTMMEPLMGDTGLLPQMQPAEKPMLYTARQEAVMQATKLPYYKPDIYPVILRKNVSRSGHFWGGSDIDAIEYQQNTLNKLGTKINQKVLGGGSFTTVPKGMGKFISDGDNRKLEVDNPAQLQSIHVYNTQVDISPDLMLRSEVYEEGRQTIGITDSMQGRKDATATSAVAKEFSAKQAAGRMESKRVMKQALFQDLFETLFKFMLAYADEPRPVIAYNEQGEKEYKLFDRHDFLYEDEAGNWNYNTDFLFSCDSAAPLASNREAMWQETRMNFQQGTYGNPQELSTLIRFWTVMEQLHYPTAKQIKAELQQELEQQKAMEQMQAAMNPMGGGMPGQPMGGGMPSMM
jgi:hypothetical protein